MFKPALRRVWPLLFSVFLVWIPTTLLGQIPESIVAMRNVGYRQISAAEVVPDTCTFVIGVTFPSTTDADTMVAIRRLNGDYQTVPRDDASSYYLEIEFDTEAEMDAIFPAGENTLRVNETDYQFSISPPTTTSKSIRITNFDDLRGWENTYLQITFNAFPEADSSTYVRLSVETLDEEELLRTPEYGDRNAMTGATNQYRFPGNVLADGSYQGVLYWAPFRVSQIPGTSVALAQATTALLRFPITIGQVTSPIILQQPQSITAPLGQATEFSVTTLGNRLTYEWFYVRELGAPPVAIKIFNYNSLASRQWPEGYYFVRVSNSHGTVDSELAQLIRISGPGIWPYRTNHSSLFEGEGLGLSYDISGLTCDESGNLWLIDGNSVKSIPLNEGIQLVAGNMIASGHDDGRGAEARFGGASQQPQGLCRDRLGNLYVADTPNHTIRKITPDGRVSTWLGIPGTPGQQDGEGNNALLQSPLRVHYDYQRDRIVIVDANETLIRSANMDAQLTTLAGDAQGNAIRDGIGPDVGFGLYALRSLCISESGDYLFVDSGRLRSLAPDTGAVETLASPSSHIYDRPSWGQLIELPGGGLYFTTSSSVTRLSRETGMGAPVIGGRGNSTVIGSQLGDSIFFLTSTGGPGGSILGVNRIGRSIYRLELPTHYRALDSNDYGPRAGRLINLSVRNPVSPDASLIAGFVNLGTSSRPLVLRAIGPTLSSFGVSSALSTPELILRKGHTEIARNLAWSGDDGRQWGAFPLPTGSNDAAIATYLADGAYTAQLTSHTNASGIALVEVYTAADASTEATPVNLSARATKSGAEPMIAGFVLGGERSRLVVIRGIGPSLASFGIDHHLLDPNLKLYQDGKLIRINEDWNDVNLDQSDDFRPAMNRAGAFPLDPDSKDSAIVVELVPGTYTVHLNSASADQRGEALIEIYLVN